VVRQAAISEADRDRQQLQRLGARLRYFHVKNAAWLAATRDYVIRTIRRG
jgi:hypothetical protein